MVVRNDDVEDWRALAAPSYARYLLREIGADADGLVGNDIHPAILWAQSGAMALTGDAEGAAVMCPAPLAACAEGTWLALAHLAGAEPDALSAARLLGERAAL